MQTVVVELKIPLITFSFAGVTRFGKIFPFLNNVTQ